MNHKPTHTDSKLDPAWLYLHAQMPPDKWYQLPSFCTASTWLSMHTSLRRGQVQLEKISQDFLSQSISWQEYRHQLLSTAHGHYGHLHGHHSLEDSHYFPKFRAREPKLAHGFDVLDNDHHHIEGRLHAIKALLDTLRQSDDKPDADLANRLHDSLIDGGVWLYRHLADEEDLVIPVLAIAEQYRLT